MISPGDPEHAIGDEDNASASFKGPAAAGESDPGKVHDSTAGEGRAGSEVWPKLEPNRG